MTMRTWSSSAIILGVTDGLGGRSPLLWCSASAPPLVVIPCLVCRRRIAVRRRFFELRREIFHVLVRVDDAGDPRFGIVERLEDHCLLGGQPVPPLRRRARVDNLFPIVVPGAAVAQSVSVLGDGVLC